MHNSVVIALGGNALGKNLAQQMEAVRRTSRAIADIIEAGNEVVITHGNGPQVGLIDLAMAAYKKNHADADNVPLSVCVAMSQGYIGYDLQNAFREELLHRGIKKPVATVITQVTVDAEDPAFLKPTKPIGGFMTEDEANKLAAEGVFVMEDAGRGYRRAVASPRPKSIVEIDTVRALIKAGQVVIASGGGGIPVTERENDRLKGAPAVIDKDLASSLLARSIDADCLIILTTVERACINYGKPDEEALGLMSAARAREYIAQGHFAPGSMLPKMQAAAEFAQSKQGRRAIITTAECACAALRGEAGTIIIE